MLNSPDIASNNVNNYLNIIVYVNIDATNGYSSISYNKSVFI